MAIIPIWKDFYANGGRDDSCQFRILADNAEVYHGRAYRRPTDANIRIRMNDICADYIPRIFPDINNVFTPNPLVNFRLEIMVDDIWEEYDDVVFYDDWSYDYDFNPQRGLSCPVNGRFVLGTPLPFSVMSASELELDVNDGDFIWYVEPTGKVAGCYMVDFNTIDFPLENGATIDLTESTNLESQKYHYVDSCARYALYYRNAYGGVDMLLMEGNHAESDNITRHTREVEYDNNNISNRGKSDYINELSKSLTLHTSWLSDDESLRMHHLLNSTEVYLFDIKEQKMIPVLLSNTTTEYKTYKGNGGKLVNYAIQVTLANDRIRR